MSALAQAQHHSLIRCTSLRLPFTMPAALLAYPAAHRCTPSLRPGSLPLAAGRRMLCLQPGAALQQRLHFLKQAPLDCGGSLGRHVQTCKTGMHAKAAPRAPCASRLSAAASSCTQSPSWQRPSCVNATGKYYEDHAGQTHTGKPAPGQVCCRTACFRACVHQSCHLLRRWVRERCSHSARLPTWLPS